MEVDAVEYHLNPDGLVDVSYKDPVLTTYHLLVQTAKEIMRYSDAVFYRKAGLSDIKFVVLMVISQCNSGNITPSEIARWTQTKPHNITMLVKRLQKDGLVKAERNEADRRFVSVTITDKGREALDQAVLPAREIVSRVMSSLSEEETVRLKDCLVVLKRNAHHALKQLEGTS